MSKRKIALTNKRQRAILTDMLPFEIPPTFSNRGFYSFVRDNELLIQDNQLSWICTNDKFDLVIRILFGFPANTLIATETAKEWGKEKHRRKVDLKSHWMVTIPFNFRVSHNIEGRSLTVIHPRNQIAVAAFYAQFSALMIYYTSLSEFSIRHPVSVSRHSYFKDRLHDENLGASGGVEEADKEYEQLGSYFVYRKYRNIHRFFESYKYHRSEKKYDSMVQIDISKCFDSVYTHSLPWAAIGKNQAKFNLAESKSTFSGRFDELMQKMNYNETNGIVIGPEFSRIFAEIILQSADVELLRKLEAAKLTHKVNYEIFRYVDDYFVFYNEQSTGQKVIELLQETLKGMKLSINSAKVKHYEKPLITEITIAKERISSLLNDEIAPSLEEVENKDAPDTKSLRLSCHIRSNRLIVRYKAAIKESNVKYEHLLNYTFAIVENKIDTLLRYYSKSDRTSKDQKRLVYSLLFILEFSFFVYSASPKVNHTVRLCRMISTAASFLHASKVPQELKHILFKYVHDNILQQIEKNAMGAHREVETLYLLVVLSEIGKDYWLPESTLAKYFLISKHPDSGNYHRDSLMNYFSITVLLSYIKEKKRYSDLRAFIESHVVRKLSYMKAHCDHDAECIMMFLDLIVCPYISGATKVALANVYGIDHAGLSSIKEANDYWFTSWGQQFDLKKELDAKRSREVY